jgi:protease-4
MPKSFLRETADTVMKSLVILLTILLIFYSLSYIFDNQTRFSYGDCNIAVLPIDGVILPFQGFEDLGLGFTPEEVESFMDRAEKDDNIIGVMTEINSPGGAPVASERIAERFRSSGLPVIGVIEDVGVSGGYMIAASTDYLLASVMSDVGSIGVNMSYLDESLKNEEEGLTYVQLTAGQFKDIGSPNRPLTEEEKQLLQTDLDIVHEHFIGLVAQYRGLEPDFVRDLADGSSMTGIEALDNNLIDQIGNRSEAKVRFAEIADLNQEEIVFCDSNSLYDLF